MGFSGVIAPRSGKFCDITIQRYNFPFKNTHFGGNESAAARAINESRERIRALRLRITTTDRREEGGKFSTAHEEIITTEVPKNPIRSIDATTEVKRDQNYFKNFLFFQQVT